LNLILELDYGLSPAIQCIINTVIQCHVTSRSESVGLIILPTQGPVLSGRSTAAFETDVL